MVALGPVASTKNLEVPALQKLAKVWREVQLIILEAGMHDLYDSNWWQEEAEKILCADIDKEICVGLLQYLADADPEVDNLDRLNVFLKDFPAGQGYQGIVYYGQDVLNTGMKRFDYGVTGNMQKYGQVKPPDVPL